MDNETMHRVLLDAIEAAAGGNHSKFAAAIGAPQQTVSYWVAKRLPLSVKYVLAAESAGFGERHRFRPDIYPPPPALAA